ncbi:MAG: hypothetical protein M0D55_02985 [Elusimicrobiota bacterium]|nr:MAG: hypothetical protein M0D55_02985 [Elusimicrobiota bacterium]
MRERKVVVVAFINPTSINSVRVLPALHAWFDRYAMSQLMVVGVLTPDLNVHREAVWVRNLLKRYGVDYPIFLDGDRRLWKAYANEGWPALYLVDRRGRIVFDRLGEGGYEEFESEIRLALAEIVGADKLPPRPTSRTRRARSAARRRPRSRSARARASSRLSSSTRTPRCAAI